MMPETIAASIITYLIMLAAFYMARQRIIHISAMVGVILFDLGMPIYLYMNRDWKERLIDGGEIFSFLIWMHLGLVLTLYVLYVIQIQAGRKLLKGEQNVRDTHIAQGKGILLTRLLVILTGALLYEPEPEGEAAE